MEQVFALMNKCLHRDREAKKRKLRVRDYKVVPLAAQAGVLEFVSHTEPLDNCLKGAHIRCVHSCNDALRKTGVSFHRLSFQIYS